MRQPLTPREAAINRVAKLLYYNIVPENKRKQERAPYFDPPWVAAATVAVDVMLNDINASSFLTPEDDGTVQ